MPLPIFDSAKSAFDTIPHEPEAPGVPNDPKASQVASAQNASEFTPQTYYPSAKIRIVVRFEEFGDPGLAADVPKKPTKDIQGHGDKRDDLQQKKVTDEWGVTRYELVSKTGAQHTKGIGAQQDRSSDNRTFEIAGIIPKTASWKQNDQRTADTLEFVVRWKDMPFDPRTIRAAAVLYYLGTVPAEDYAGGIAGGTRSRTAAQGGSEALNLIPDFWSDGVRTRTNLRFEGWVDEAELEWDDENEPVVRFKCTDNTRLLLDQEHPPQLGVDPGLPIDQAIAGYLAKFPQMRGLLVEYRPTIPRDQVPVSKKVLAKTAYAPTFGPPNAKQGGAAQAPNVMDYLSDVCGAIGHRFFMEGSVLVIQRVASIYDITASRRESDPYTGRHVESGTYPVRAFIYGRNILKLKIKRQFTRRKPKNIEVRCYDTANKTMIVARHPKKSDGRVVSPNPGDGTTEQKWEVVKVGGVSDEKTLAVIAEDIYNLKSRQELGVEVETKNIASFGGGNSDPDLLDMQPGDAFQVLVNRDLNTTQTDAEDRIQGATKFITDIGYSQEIAEAYAQAYRNRAMQTGFIAKEVLIDWSCDDGVSFKLNGINFVEVRAAKPSKDLKATLKAAQASPKRFHTKSGDDAGSA